MQRQLTKRIGVVILFVLSCIVLTLNTFIPRVHAEPNSPSAAAASNWLEQLLPPEPHWVISVRSPREGLLDDFALRLGNPDFAGQFDRSFSFAAIPTLATSGATARSPSAASLSGDINGSWKSIACTHGEKGHIRVGQWDIDMLRAQETAATDGTAASAWIGFFGDYPQVRVVAIDDGDRMRVGFGFKEWNGSCYNSLFVFPNLTLVQIRRFEIQIRSVNLDTVSNLGGQS